MLCKQCSNIDLDQLADVQGYKHHASCEDLLQSSKNGCESCQLICDSQMIETGGDILGKGHDLGASDTQIIARAVNQKPGEYHRIRYGQEVRSKANQGRLMKEYTPVLQDVRSPDSPFLWSFLTVVADSDDLSSRYLKLRPLAGRQPENWLSFAAGWLEECLKNHDICSTKSSKVHPPTRVIDVGPSDGSEDPFLHTSGHDVQQWVTLSHCWGNFQPLRTTLSSIADHRNALSMEKLPNQFQDAVKITRALKYRYLWIDSLCIIQDSQEDWDKEAANMGSIYKHCVFAISAGNCRDSRDHILENHIPFEIKCVKQDCHSSIEGFESVMYAFNDDEWRRDSNPGFLKSRAWGAQEQILAPRTLEWTPLQLIWNCRCLTHSEQNPSEIEPDINRPLEHVTKRICLSPEQFKPTQEQLESYKLGWKLRKYDPLAIDHNALQMWYHMVIQFCARNITFEEDSLPAISGLAKEVKKHLGYDYRAGLWEQDIHNGLLWIVNGIARYPSVYVAPSWSWASVKSGFSLVPAYQDPTAIRFSDDEHLVFTPVADILGIDILYSGQDEFGRIKSGKISLSAPYKSVSSFEKDWIRLPTAKDKIWADEHGPLVYEVKPLCVTCWLDSRPEEEKDDEEFSKVQVELSSGGAIVVQIAFVDKSHYPVLHDSNFYNVQRGRALQHQNWGLVLKPAGSGEEEEWKRVGVARIADELVEGWETRVFTIV